MPQLTVEETRIVYMAERVAAWAYGHLLNVCGVPQDVALESAKDAGYAFAARLTLTLKEHNVVIEATEA